MKILTFESLPSTHLFLSEKIKTGELKAPILVVAHQQNSGIGSRGNVWSAVKEGLYFSFAITEGELPNDLAIESVSIYFGYLFKEVLAELGSQVFLKWPNDLYLGEKKIGGILCTKISQNILVGIGLNLVVEDSAFGALDISVSKEQILFLFIEKIKIYTWKQIFSKYKLEFPRNFSHGFHYKGRLMGMDQAILCEDGAVLIGNEKIYSLR